MLYKNVYVLARRRAAAKRKKLKNLGKSKSTDTEEEEGDDDCADDGKYSDSLLVFKLDSSMCSKMFV